MDRLDFEALVDATPAGNVELNPGARLTLPSVPHPFIPPKLLANQGAGDPLVSEVILISSPAAVGKTAAAQYLAATRRQPFLDLARVHVSTNALVGLITTDITRPANALDELHSGRLTVIVDALDEGRMLSGDANVEKFLETSWELLLRDRSSPHGPKLILFGREHAAELVEISLLTLAPDLGFARLTLDFFDARDATEVVMAHARETARSHGRPWEDSPAIRQTVEAFYEAIASALELAPEDLWRDPQGRAFAGYAPILAAIGRLVALEPNPMRLKNALQSAGAKRAWDVIEHVAHAILVREQEEKVRPQLKEVLSRGAPADAYDPAEQLAYLTQLVHGQRPTVGSRFNLTPDDREAYDRIVRQQLPEHPFLQAGQIANEVLASIVLAHAIGNDLLRGSESPHLRRASRQPFLWRAVRRFVERVPDTLVGGEYVGCILNSLWNDSLAEVFRVTVDQDEGLSVFTVREPQESWTFHAVDPVEFYEQLSTCDCRFRSEVRWQGHRGEVGAKVFDLRGDVTFVAERRLKIEAEAVRLDGDIRLAAETLEQPPHLRATVSDGTRVWFGGAFATVHPWNQYPATLESPEERAPATALEDLLQRLARAFPPGAPITVYKFKFRLTNDRRTAWIARDFGAERFSALLELMTQHGLARAAEAAASGPRPMVKVHFLVTWDQLLQALRRPESSTPAIRALLQEAQRLFSNGR